MNLTQWREAEGLTQTEAAAFFEVDQSVYSRWESGARLPTMRSAARIIVRTNGKVALADLLPVDVVKDERAAKAKKGCR